MKSGEKKGGGEEKGRGRRGGEERGGKGGEEGGRRGGEKRRGGGEEERGEREERRRGKGERGEVEEMNTIIGVVGNAEDNFNQTIPTYSNQFMAPPPSI